MSKPSCETCPRCRGKGTVIARLERVGFGAGFQAFMAGCPKRYDAEGNYLGQEIVCPVCNGKAADTPTKGTTP